MTTPTAISAMIQQSTHRLEKGMRRSLAICFVLLLAATGAIAAQPEVYAVIDGSGNVVNTIEWDGVTPWSPPAGDTAIPTNGAPASIGWTWDGFQFNPPAK
jgi:hypothetical protein